MKRSKHVALWLTGSLAVSGCHRTPDGNWAPGAQPSTTGTNNSQNGSWGSYSHTGGGHWFGSGSGWSFGGEEGGVSRGGFGGHGGEGFGGE